MKTPELDKLSALEVELDGARRLWEWLHENGYVVAEWQASGRFRGGEAEEELVRTMLTCESAVLKAFGVNEKALEAERRQLLTEFVEAACER